MVTIQENTTVDPISLIGKEAGICWGANTADQPKNYKRGLGCISSGHDRTMEYPQVYMILDGYSAKVIRELYTHIGGSPTRLQASTRYINYDSFKFVTPPTILNNDDACMKYSTLMGKISAVAKELESMGIPREDANMVLPLSMQTKVVVRTNLRQLVDMSRVRMCNRAYWEFRILMRDILDALAAYSPEWNIIVNDLKLFHAKCDEVGYCNEEKSCGRKPKR